ncbi:MAG: 5'/3'-nucleotidase SurE [Candidatus Heimdallarchaeota archaeon]|nr:5'/3'-nucleotidase SurE [Candidatus Heimdallarchaeota archaeon]
MNVLKILLVNDDGVDSPALIPTIECLSSIGEVTTVVPKSQKSWTSKINTRSNTKLEYEIRQIDGYTVHVLDGYPSDCANFGIYEVVNKPDLVISGANVGHNVGIHAFFSSGTVGGAIDGVIAGIPSIAISVAYKKGQELASDGYRPPLTQFTELVKYFYNNRPSEYMMLSINMPMYIGNSKVVATELHNFSFGSLFKIEDGYVIPRHYYDLNNPYSDLEGFDTWARKNDYTSVVAFDYRVQMIDRAKVETWLNNLNR